jgi:alpha-ketoglutarate-dependent taurine dioxygenase
MLTSSFAPVIGRSVWNVAQLQREDYFMRLSDFELDRLDDALRSMNKAIGGLENSSGQGFMDAGLRDLSWNIQRRLSDERGFVVIAGWNKRGWSEEALRTLLWGLGGLIGYPRIQNQRGHRISVVAKDDSSSGRVAGDSTVSRGDDEIRFHTEKGRLPIPPRLIALLCLGNAASGGASRLISGHSIHNRLMAERPDALARLHQPYPFGRHDEPYPDGQRVDWAPVFSRRDARLVVRYNRPWVHVAERDLDARIDAPGLAALDAIEALLDAPELTAEFVLNPGELLIVDNRVVLHARTKFFDGDSPSEKRRLLRLWMD